MKSNDNNKKVHIGTIGYTDHSKRTLKYAVEQALKNKSNNIEEYPYKFDIKVIEDQPKVLKKKR